ncbi:hypothetical protein C5167_035231 [Papaver somniferum]|uniref:Uncharacterized protein n=1 Tax=Papaver somniferum TaxID=3469 RepID=A0A4Y7KGT5_PAPSO|nr:hypothetical protein C5167_035231 [Papaver somniferum]
MNPESDEVVRWLYGFLNGESEDPKISCNKGSNKENIRGRTLLKGGKRT